MWFALFSIIFYILSLLLIAPFLMNSLEGKLSQSKIPFFLTALAAIILHAVSTFPLLEDLASGQRFTLMGIASLMSAVIAALATLSMFLVSTMWFVLPIVYAFSIISLIFATFLSSHIIQMLNQNTLMLFHIGLSLFTYAVCFIATLYVIQLVWLDRNLKKRKIQFFARNSTINGGRTSFLLFICDGRSFTHADFNFGDLSCITSGDSRKSAQSDFLFPCLD